MPDPKTLFEDLLTRPIKRGTFDISRFEGCYAPPYVHVPPVEYRPGDRNEEGLIFSHYIDHNLYRPVFVTPQKWQAKLERRAQREQAQKAKYYEDHEASKKAARDYYAKNRERIIARAKRRVENDPVVRFERGLRVSLRAAFHNRNLKKSKRCEKLLGMTLEDFRRKVESQFLPGMTLENRSEWHLDHIIPLAIARTVAEVEVLNHHSNLRPIWGADNIRKHARLPEDWELPENIHPEAKALLDRVRKERAPR